MVEDYSLDGMFPASDSINSQVYVNNHVDFTLKYHKPAGSETLR